MEEVSIKPVEKKDLPELAKIYVELYDKAGIDEHWTQDTAYKLLKYWYDTQPDLFICAYENNLPVGAVMSGVKPWWDGIHIQDTEIFVSKKYQNRGIAKMLYKEHYQLAIEKYNVTVMEALTYEDENGFPLKWYLKQGFEVIDNLVIISGNVKEALEKI